MASLAIAADEPIEAMDQVEGEERAEALAEEAGVAADEATEAMGQMVEGEARAEAHAEEETAATAADEPVEAMEQVEEERVEVEASADEPTEEMEQVEGEERAEVAAADEPTEAMERVEGEERAEVADAGELTEAMEQDEGEERAEGSLPPALPVGRVKKIIRVDRDIRKLTAEASLLIAAATELFLGSLATGAHTAAAQRGRRAVRAAHVRDAVRAHRPTADFLLDCLPDAEEAPRPRSTARSDGGASAAEGKPLPRGARRIDAFFHKVT